MSLTVRPNSDQRQSYEQLWVVQLEKLAGDLLLELKFVRLEVLLTSFIDFLYEELGELRSQSLALKGFRIQ